jgi:hypothetical protein
MQGSQDGEGTVATVAMVELPWALDLPQQAPDMPPAPETSEGIDADPAALTRGVMVGLGVSVPLWLGFAWLVISLVAVLPIG